MTTFGDVEVINTVPLRCRKHTDCRGNGGVLKGEWCSFFEFICVEPCPECLAEAKKEGREEANEDE